MLPEGFRCVLDLPAGSGAPQNQWPDAALACPGRRVSRQMLSTSGTGERAWWRTVFIFLELRMHTGGGVLHLKKKACFVLAF